MSFVLLVLEFNIKKTATTTHQLSSHKTTTTTKTSIAHVLNQKTNNPRLLYNNCIYIKQYCLGKKNIYVYNTKKNPLAFK